MVDAIDIRILDILVENSRLSFADIGRMIHLSPSAVRERIQRMEEKQVIEKYSLQINHQKLGYGLEAFMLLKVFPGQLKAVIEKVKEFPEIKESYRITGSQNLHLKIVVKDQLALQELLDKLMVFGDTTTYLILSEI